MISSNLGWRPYANTSGAFFNGLIDDVRYYNRILSAEEIQTLYKMGSNSTRDSEYKFITRYGHHGGASDQSHEILLFFDPHDKALVIEIRADYRSN